MLTHFSCAVQFETLPPSWQQVEEAILPQLPPDVSLLQWALVKPLPGQQQFWVEGAYATLNSHPA